MLINYNNQVDLEKVYSQAIALVGDKSFKYYFDKDDVAKLEENNKMFILLTSYIFKD